MQYNYNQVKEELEKLLRSHKCLTAYKEEFKANEKKHGLRDSYEDYLKRNCSRGDVRTLISSPFVWAETKKGHVFWSDIEKEWDTINNNTDWKEAEA